MYFSKLKSFILTKSPWLLIVVIAFGLYVYTFDAKIHYGGDNAEYYQLGQGFTLNKGYVNAMLVDEPLAVHYPPGYPFILSIPMRLGITDMYWLKWLNGLFFLGSLVLIFKIVYSLESKWWVAFLVGILCATNTNMLTYSFIIMSEIPYTFTALLSLYAIKKYQFDGQELSSNKKYMWLVVAIFAAVASYYIRSIGIVIPIAMVLFFLIEKNWKALLITVSSSIALIAPWMIRMDSVGGGSYQNQLLKINPYRPELGDMESLGDWGNRFWANLSRYTSKEIESAMFNFFDWGPKSEQEWWMVGIGIALLVLGIVGLYALDKSVRNFFTLFVLGHFGVLMLWPEVWYGPRFMLSTVPVLWYLVIKSVLFILQKTIRTTSTTKYVGIALVVLLMVFQFKPINNLRTLSQGRYNPSYQEYFDLAKAVKEQYDEEMVISCRKPAFFYLLSGKKVTSYLFTADHDELIKDLAAKKVTHVVLDNLGFSSTARYLYPAIKNKPDNFQLIARKEGANTYLFKFVHP